MSIPITCGGCKSAFEVPDTLAGKTIRCTSCKAQMTVPESLDEVVEAVEEIEAIEEVPSGEGKKPFGFGSGATKSDLPATPKKAPAKPTPSPAAKSPATKKTPAPAEVDADESDEDEKPKAKPGKPAPAAKKSGITGAPKKRRDDDDDDDDDKPKKKKKGGSPMIAIVAVAALGLAAIAGGGIWYFTKAKKPDDVAKTDTPPANTPNNPVPPPGGGVVNPPAGENGLGFGKLDRLGTPGPWAQHSGDGFTADFLGQPEEKNENADGGVSVKMTGVGTKDGGMMVMLMQFPPAVAQATNNNPKALLDLMVSGMTKELKGKVPVDAVVDGHPAKEIDMRDATGDGLMRITAVKDRVYMFVVGGDRKNGKPAVSQADINRFLASIKITYTGGPGTIPGSPGNNPLATFAKFERLGTDGPWAPFTGDGFNAEFPGQPEEKTENGPNNLPLKFTGVGAKDGVIVLAGFLQFPPEVVQANANNPLLLLNLATTMLTKEEPFKNLPAISTTVDTHAARELSLKDATGEAKVRIVAVKGRVYAFAAGGAMKDGKPTLAQAESERFFASIKITYKGDAVAVGPGPQPGPGPMPGPGDPPAGNNTDGNLKIKIDPFYTAAFDAEKKEVYTIDGRPTDAITTKGWLRRYSYPDFKMVSRFKLPQLGSRALIDSKAGLLYVATVTNPRTAQINLLDNASASGSIAIFDLKQIRDGKAADGKILDDGAELKPLATVSLLQMINAIELSADGKFLYVLTTTSTIPKRSQFAIFDTETRKEVLTDGKRKVLPELVRDMAKAGDGKNLLIIEELAKNNTASVVAFDVKAMAVINPTSFKGPVLDIAPLTGGGAMVTVLAGNQPAGGGVGGNPGGGIAPQPPPMPPGGGAGPQISFKLFMLKGSTEMDLGVGAKAANGGYVEFDPENRKLYVSSFRDKGLDVYEWTEADGASGLKLKASIKTAKNEGLGGHFFVAPDGKTLLFHTGVVIDTANIVGAAGVVPPPGGVVVPPPGGGVVVPPPGGGVVVPPGGMNPEKPPGGKPPVGGPGAIPGGPKPSPGGTTPLEK